MINNRATEPVINLTEVEWLQDTATTAMTLVTAIKIVWMAWQDMAQWDGGTEME